MTTPSKSLLRHKAYQFRIYPNPEQEILITKTIGCCRFIYNHFLNLWNKAYLKTGKGLSYTTCSAMLPDMKKDEATHWLKEVDSIASEPHPPNQDLEGASIDLNTPYKQ